MKREVEHRVEAGCTILGHRVSGELSQAGQDALAELQALRPDLVHQRLGTTYIGRLFPGTVMPAEDAVRWARADLKSSLSPILLQEQALLGYADITISTDAKLDPQSPGAPQVARQRPVVTTEEFQQDEAA
jgi:hypothetical protein